MELNIPRNDYVENTTIREDVVNAICQAFLSKTCWSHLHPRTTSLYRRASSLVVKHKGGSEYYGFISGCDMSSFDEGIKYTRYELDKAIKGLIEYGYHVWYVSCEWSYIKVTRTPYYNERGAREIFEFNGYID